MNPLVIEDQLTGYVDQNGREYAVHIKFLRIILWLSIATTPLVRGTDVGLHWIGLATPAWLSDPWRSALPPRLDRR
jgi:hypothetical protein